MDHSIRKRTKAELIEIYRNSDKTVKPAPPGPALATTGSCRTPEEWEQYRTMRDAEILANDLPF